MSRKPLFALVDCNNFFVSCERLFRPDISTVPVVVMSSNDGCFVARSNEAKALGIPMGAPVFKYREILKQHNVVCFSANFELYADISRRITTLLAQVCPRIETYSIDESFLDISTLSIQNYTTWSADLRHRIEQEIGIPVSIGVAGSKTLAKLASGQAKKRPELGGSLILTQPSLIDDATSRAPVEDIWGVGYRLAPRLRAAGLFTANHIAKARPALMKQLVGSVHGPQLSLELNGTSCIPLEQAGKPQKMIMRGRTFGHATDSEAELLSVLTAMTARAAFRLREQGQVCCRAALTLETSRHKPNYVRHHVDHKFAIPTADTGKLIGALHALLESIREPRRQYTRLNIHLLDLLPTEQLQYDLFTPDQPAETDTDQRRMHAIDSINTRHGRSAISYASEHLGTSWQPQRDLASPRYVSNWDELPSIQLYTKA